MIAIIHGAKATPQSNWFPWLSAELKALGHDARVPAMPTPEGQSYLTWRKAFYEQCGDLTPDSILVGHSVGAAFILRMLDETDVTVKAVILVAPFMNKIGLPEYDALNASFVGKAVNWKSLRRKAQSWHCVMGDKDPYIPMSIAYETPMNLGIKPTIIKGGGHLNAESGYTQFPLVLDLILASISR